MLIAMFIWWLAIAVLAALAVQKLWRGVISARALDLGLLPGTLAARMGYALGVLITGGTVQRLSLVESEEGRTDDAGGALAWLRSTFAALLPMLGCAAGIVLLVRWLGISSAQSMLTQRAAASVQFSLAGAWEFLRDTVDLLQSSLSAALRSNPFDWRYWVFLYLLICLTLRLAPSRANLRPALLAVLLMGVVLAIAGFLTPDSLSLLRRGWGVLSLVVATNLLLLVLTLLARGAVELIRTLRGGPAGA
jgi:hypothetical protein